MERLTSWVKSHPYAAGAAVLVAGLVILFWFRTPEKVANTGSTTGGAVASGVIQGTALQQAQLGYNAQVAVSANQVEQIKAAANASVQAVALQENTKVAAYADMLAAVQDTNSSNVSIEGIRASVPITQAKEATAQAALAAQTVQFVTANNNSTQLAITNSNNSVTNHAIDAQFQTAIHTADLNALTAQKQAMLNAATAQAASASAAAIAASKAQADAVAARQAGLTQRQLNAQNTNLTREQMASDAALQNVAYSLGYVPY